LFSIIDLMIIVLFAILTVYFLSVGFVLVRYYRKKNNSRQQLESQTKETSLSKSICPQCKKPYGKPLFEFEEMYKDENNSEILVKSISRCPNCKAEIKSRMFSSTKREIT